MTTPIASAIISSIVAAIPTVVRVAAIVTILPIANGVGAVARTKTGVRR